MIWKSSFLKIFILANSELKFVTFIQNYTMSFKTTSVVKPLSRVWLCNPMDCSPPGSTVHGIFQARILEWVAISFSRVSSWPRDWTQVSCIVRRRFYRLSHQGSGHIIILSEAHFELKSDFFFNIISFLKL